MASPESDTLRERGASQRWQDESVSRGAATDSQLDWRKICARPPGANSIPNVMYVLSVPRSILYGCTLSFNDTSPIRQRDSRAKLVVRQFGPFREKQTAPMILPVAGLVLPCVPCSAS